ncbi:MAG TPA: metallophosphoesterase family protein [Phycisphaerae bacterium]|jgi:putative phosphoesterase
MRILMLSDIHANPWAFDAVLGDAGTVDHLLFAGDAVNYGPDPRAVIARLQKRGAISVRGNHDHAVAYVADPRASAAKQSLALAMRDWTRAQLDAGQRTWLARLPLHLIWEIGGVRMALYHGTPHGPLFDYEFVPNLPPRRVKELVCGVEADLLVLGHTHLPFVRPCGHLTIVNPGSVGQPLDGDPRAAYAVWQDGHITLGRVAYDVDAAADALDQTELRPEQRDALSATLRTGRME